MDSADSADSADFVDSNHFIYSAAKGFIFSSKLSSEMYLAFLFIIIIYLLKVDEVAKILHAQKIYMLINVNYLIKSELNKK